MKTKLIAELCQNHNGDSGLILDMVAAAKESGAEYVKLQTIHSSQLSHRSRFDEGLIEGGIVKAIKRPYKDEFERLSRLDINDKTVENFLKACEKYKLKPMTTIFTRDVVKKTFNQGFTNIKLASFDCISVPLAEEILEYGPELFIVSTGCSFKNEIKTMANVLKQSNKTAMLHCTSIYPTPIHEANLNRIDFLKKIIPRVGLSDHSCVDNDGLEIIKWAICKDIEFIERHFTILPKDQTKDGKVSLNPSEFRQVYEITNWDQKKKEEFMSNSKETGLIVNGDLNRELSNEEYLNRDYYQGRFVSRTVDHKEIFNWDKGVTKNEILHAN